MKACSPVQSGITRPVCGASSLPRALLALFFNFDRAAAHRHLGAGCGLPRGPWTGANALVCAMHRFQAVPAQNRALRRGNAAFGHPRPFAVFFHNFMIVTMNICIVCFNTYFEQDFSKLSCSPHTASTNVKLLHHTRPLCAVRWSLFKPPSSRSRAAMARFLYAAAVCVF